MTTLRVARVPYLNTDPFFPEPGAAVPMKLIDLPPRLLGEAAARGEIDAGPMAVVDYFRQQEAFEPLGDFGIAALGEAKSVLLFSQRPLSQLDGCAIDVTDQTSTSGMLLRLLLEQRYDLRPASYHRVNGDASEPACPRNSPEAGGACLPRQTFVDRQAEARLLIGDEALRMRTQDYRMPYRIDLGSEWWLWQALPFVFAIWVVRKEVAARAKHELIRQLGASLDANLADPSPIARRRTTLLAMPEAEIGRYLRLFRYRLNDHDRQGMARFKELLDAHHLL